MTEALILRKVLTEKVTYTGTDFLGRQTTITFFPANQRGWWWNTGTDIVPVDHRILHFRKRRLVLVHGKSRFHIPEHLFGPLRFLGFDGVIVSCSRNWPPYDARPYEIWEKLVPFMHEDGSLIQFKGLDACGLGSNKIGFSFLTQVSDRPAEGLSVRIDVDYREIGKGGLAWHSGEQDKLLEFLKAPAPVYPPRIRYPAEVCQRIGIWKHSHRVSWLHKTEPKAWTQNALRHRLIDALGAFGLLFHEELPLGFIHSDKSGHACDFLAIQKLLRNVSRV